ncbi:MAG: T9SS type A sorting domain-containing protein [Bacteroidota bacterium]|nr:T9SS type A sorting domain-containing protein [Bacteroidota bacterium]MDE2957800.1 T9SS type A sorting domain-containing protein [Bacteroidota bacterium]
MGTRTVVLLGVGCALMCSVAAQNVPPALLSCWAPEVRHLPPAPHGPAKQLPPIIREEEPDSVRLLNDSPLMAEHLADFSPHGLNAVEVQGVLAMPEPVDMGLASEEESDDGSIILARQVPLSSGSRARFEAIIGDGPHGSGGSQTGDYDFYGIGRLMPGQVLTVDITTEPVEPRLDTKVALYNSRGDRLEQNDDGIFGQRDSYLQTVIAQEDDYFVIVRGINSDWPSDPFDPASGPKVGSEGPYTVTLGLDATDTDWFSMDLRAGDVVSASVRSEALLIMFADTRGDTLMQSDLDRSVAYADTSPLLRGGNANLAHVAPHDGRFAMAAATGSGAYSLHLAVFRPGLEAADSGQILFVDFDGAAYDASALGGRANAQLSPLVHFLALQQLEDEEDAIIDRALAVVAENLIEDLKLELGGRPALQLLNSRDHTDPWGAPNVSRIIVGGSQHELGLNTIGIAESIDVGNFKHNETAVVLLDVITDPLAASSFASVERAPHVSMADLLGLALGNVIAHEAGHLFASFHTGHPDYPVQLMAGGPDPAAFVGAGADRVLGTADDRDIDLGRSPYKALEGYMGFQDTRSAVGYGLLAGLPLTVESEVPDAPELGPVYPNPSSDEVWLTLPAGTEATTRYEVFNMLGRRVYQRQVEHRSEPVRIPVRQWSAGVYAIRVIGASRWSARYFTVVR